MLAQERKERLEHHAQELRIETSGEQNGSNTRMIDQGMKHASPEVKVLPGDLQGEKWEQESTVMCKYQKSSIMMETGQKLEGTINTK
ncbi:hypothetical protein AV530_008827 [Patagioenas fasciata monilis]|uniref:Uncharacterized protein n=1 Tax=Patagioenas fasciata monilis TaxID=372326 RepID=A0A1V4JTS7_PATFA|nr:hypothetical protein AV530_008827 [Patagioenas fasciata monilis]